MDKYEYRVKTEQMVKLVSKKDYKTAMQIADTIDWRRVKSVAMLCTVSEIYEKSKRYEESREVLLIAYDRAPIGRMIVYRLAELALKMGDMEEAIDCYEEFVHIAPRDSGRYILEYKILRRKKAPLEKQIAVLEQLKKVDYHERWAYELARLYEEAGQLEQCIELCDELALWFSDGEYVIRALELKSKYQPLTAIQQEAYRNRNEADVYAEPAYEEPVYEEPAADRGAAAEQLANQAGYAPQPESGYPQGYAPQEESVYQQGYAPQEESVYQQGYVPQEESVYQQGYAPQDESVYQHGYAPQDESVYQQGYAPQDESVYQQGYAPQEESVYQQGYAPQEENIYQGGYAPQSENTYQAGYAPQEESGYQPDYMPQPQPVWAETAGTLDTEERGKASEFRLPDQEEKIRTIYIPDEVLHPEKKRRENHEPKRRESSEPRRSGILDKFFNKEKETPNKEYPDFDSIQVEAFKEEPQYREEVQYKKEPKYTEKPEYKEEMEYRVPQVQVGKFDTMNLQAELAKSMAELLNNDSVQQPEPVQSPEEEIEKKEKLLHAQTKKITDEDSQGKLLGNTKEFVLLPKQQPLLSRQQPRKVKDFREVLSEDNDGQISLFIEEQKLPEKQITGQMNLDEILEEWNRTKQAAQEAIAEAAKKKEENHVNREPVQEEESQIPEEIRDLLNELEAESQDSLWSLRGRSNPDISDEVDSEASAVPEMEITDPGEAASEDEAEAEPDTEQEPEEAGPVKHSAEAEDEIWAEPADGMTEEPAEVKDEAEEEPSEADGTDDQDDQENEDGPKLRVRVEAAIPPEVAVERSLNAAAAALEKAVALGAALTGKKSGGDSDESLPEAELPAAEAAEEPVIPVEEPAEPETYAEEPTEPEMYAEEPMEETQEPEAEPEPAAEDNPYASLDSMMGIWPPKQRVEPDVNKPLEEKTEEELYAEMIGGRSTAAFEMVKEIMPEEAEAIPENHWEPEEEPVFAEEKQEEEVSFDTSTLNLAQEVAAMMGNTEPEESGEYEAPEEAAADSLPYEEAVQEETVQPEYYAEEYMPGESINEAEPEEEVIAEETEPEEPQQYQEPEQQYEQPENAPVLRERTRELQRDKLTDGQKKLFSYFMSVRGMEEYIAGVIYDDLYNDTRNGTSCSGNILVIGRPGAGKTSLAINVVKAIQKERNLSTGKLAKVTGESLNKKNISDIVSKIYGGALLIEQAGKMNMQTAENLSRVLEGDTGELLILMEDERKPLMKLLETCPKLSEQFTSKLEVPVFMNDELVAFGETYAREFGYKIDDMGVLALYSRIDELQREDHAVTVGEVKEIVDEAIARADKSGVKKFMKSIFKKKNQEGGRKLLLEQDFGIK